MGTATNTGKSRSQFDLAPRHHRSARSSPDGRRRKNHGCAAIPSISVHSGALQNGVEALVRLTLSRLYIVASVTALVATMYPGLHQYLTEKACLSVATLDSSGVTNCPYGSERMPVAAVQWFQVPGAASIAVALLTAGVLVLLFTFRDRMAARDKALY